MSAKRHDSDECLAAGAIAAGNFPKQFTQASHSGRVPSCRSMPICEFEPELER
jgi:hypothetical protein